MTSLTVYLIDAACPDPNARIQGSNRGFLACQDFGSTPYMLFPIRRQTWASAVIGHNTGSILFAIGHHALMVAMRIPWYAVNGREYVWREPFANNRRVEISKLSPNSRTDLLSCNRVILPPVPARRFDRRP